jgi:hypothetical protein
MLPRPDCCHEPTLRALLVTSEAPDGEIILERCANCRVFWLVIVQERMNMDGGTDSIIQTFERLTDTQANELLFGSAH